MRYHRLPHRCCTCGRPDYSALRLPPPSRTGAGILWCLRVPVYNKQARTLPMGPSQARPGPSRPNLSGRGNGEGPQGRRHAAHGFRIGDF